MAYNAAALGVLLLAARLTAVVFNITTSASTCADLFRAAVPSAGQLLANYHPVREKYVKDYCTLSASDVGFTSEQFLFLQLMGGTTSTGYRLRRTPEEPDVDPATLGHVVLPYRCQGSEKAVVFIVPFIETSGPGCFNWPDLLVQANNTASGLLTFSAKNATEVFYYLPSPVKCGRAEISSVFAGAAGTVDLSAIPATVIPLNSNCDTVGVDSAATFVNGIGWNYCFWIFFCTLLLITGYTVISESEVTPDAKQKNNWLTHHPVYSLHFSASVNYPKHARMVQLVVVWAGLVFFQAAILHAVPDMSRGILLGLLPLCSALFGLLLSLATSWLLGLAYATNRAFARQMRGVESLDDRLNISESWERKQYRAYFLFYILAGLVIVSLLIAGIVLLQNFDNDAQAPWLLGVALAVVWALLVIEPLLALLAKTLPAADRLLRQRGFWFDYDTAAEIESYHLQ